MHRSKMFTPCAACLRGRGERFRKMGRKAKNTTLVSVTVSLQLGM